MAKTAYDPKVGQRVYKPYQPTMAGVITEVMPTIGLQHTKQVMVRWVNGALTQESSLWLNDFDGLVDDTQQKLNTHLATKAKLEELEPVTA